MTSSLPVTCQQLNITAFQPCKQYLLPLFGIHIITDVYKVLYLNVKIPGHVMNHKF